MIFWTSSSSRLLVFVSGFIIFQRSFLNADEDMISRSWSNKMGISISSDSLE